MAVGYIVGVFDSGAGRCAPDGLMDTDLTDFVVKQLKAVKTERAGKIPASAIVGLIIQGKWRCKEA